MSPGCEKEAAYRGLVRPIFEYGSCVWDTNRGVVLQQEIEKKSSEYTGLLGLLLVITALKLGV